MSVANPNDPASNKEVADKLLAIRERADKQPISYLSLLRETLEVADEQFHRAMCAEAEIYRLRAASMDSQSSTLSSQDQPITKGR